ncbi:hypothetical protein CYY_004576, partial [Polysphondylium violaceum]
MLNFTNSVNTAGDPFCLSTNENVKKQYGQIVDQLKSDPFTVVDVEKFGHYSNDPLEKVTGDGHDSYFIGDNLNSTLQSLPSLGQALSFVLSPFWPDDLELNYRVPVGFEGKEEENQQEGKEEEEKEKEFDPQEKIKEYQDEINKQMNEKVEESQKSIWNEKSANFFNNPIFKAKEMKSSIDKLKVEIKENNGDITKVASSSKQCSYEIAEFCKQQKNLNEFIDIYMQSILLQSICINQLNTFWYQLDLEQSFVLGQGKDQISLRQHYHNLMVDCLKTINKPIYDNINQDKEPLNKFYFDSAKTMLFSDMWLYSIPLIVAPLDIPRLPTKDIQYGVPILTIPTDAQGPFIYRIDGLNMLPKLAEDQYRPIPKLDPLTSCYGTFLNVENNIKIKLTTKRNIMVRIFGIYPKGVQQLKVGSSKLESVQQYVPCLPVMFKKPKSYESGLNQDEILQKQNQYLESNGATSGFSCVSKMLKNVQLCSID